MERSELPRMEGSVSLAALSDISGASLKLGVRSCVDAADIVAKWFDMPRDFVRSLVCLDLLGATAVPPRRRIAREIGVSLKLLRAYEHAAELIDPQLRFDIIKTSVRVMRASQIGGFHA